MLANPRAPEIVEVILNFGKKASARTEVGGSDPALNVSEGAKGKCQKPRGHELEKGKVEACGPGTSGDNWEKTPALLRPLVISSKGRRRWAAGTGVAWG